MFTSWIYCRICEGEGCKACDYHGGFDEQIYEDSINVPLDIVKSLYELGWINLSQVGNIMSLESLYSLIIEKSMEK